VIRSIVVIEQWSSESRRRSSIKDLNDVIYNTSNVTASMVHSTLVGLLQAVLNRSKTETRWL
jgi:hypothetical protein